MVSLIRFEIKPLDDVMARFGNQLGALGEQKARLAMARTLNHEGPKIKTQVIRALVKQTSAPRPTVVAALKISKANNKVGPLEYKISGSGSELPLSLFNPKQFAGGSRAKVWGKLESFPHAFIFRGTYRSGNPVAGMNIFHRVSGASLPIEKMFGPSIPKEMVLAETKATFEKAVDMLAPRLAHEIERLLPG